MESPVIPNAKDLQLLKAATSLLVERAYDELNNKNKETALPTENSIFGKAAPIVTLEGAVRLLIALAKGGAGEGAAAPELQLSGADLALVEGFLRRTRKRGQQQALLPNSNQ